MGKEEAELRGHLRSQMEIWERGKARESHGGEENGGEGGIRTLGTVTRTHAFQAGSLNHSDTSPQREDGDYRGRSGGMSKIAGVLAGWR